MTLDDKLRILLARTARPVELSLAVNGFNLTGPMNNDEASGDTFEAAVDAMLARRVDTMKGDIEVHEKRIVESQAAIRILREAIEAVRPPPPFPPAPPELDGD